jgi:hypothetical protein
MEDSIILCSLSSPCHISLKKDGASYFEEID